MHKNAILLLNFDVFLDEVRSGRSCFRMKLWTIFLWTVLFDLSGKNSTHFYYKQRVYDFVLQEKNDFMSRMMLGHEVFVELNKRSLKSRVVAKERYPNEVVVNDHGLFKMIQSEDKIEVVSLLTNKTIVTYHKHVGLCDSEVFVEVANEILMIQCRSKLLICRNILS